MDQRGLTWVPRPRSSSALWLIPGVIFIYLFTLWPFMHSVVSLPPLGFTGPLKSRFCLLLKCPSCQLTHSLACLLAHALVSPWPRHWTPEGYGGFTWVGFQPSLPSPNPLYPLTSRGIMIKNINKLPWRLPRASVRIHEQQLKHAPSLPPTLMTVQSRTLKRNARCRSGTRPQLIIHFAGGMLMCHLHTWS